MNILTIAGSDPSGGAGVQGDLKTFASLGAHGLSVITSITSQSSSRFYETEPVPARMIRSQIRSVLEDFEVSAIKIGMVYNRASIVAIHSELEDVSAPIVLDPVIRSSTGGVLLERDALPPFRKLLVPLSSVITPNREEAEKITGLKIRSMKDMERAAKKMAAMGARSVIIKGGHMGGRRATDMVLDGGHVYTRSEARLPVETHGGGCLYSASLAVFLARGYGLRQSSALAQKASVDAIRHARNAGRGLAIAAQQGRDAIEAELSEAIQKFASMEGTYRLIPEVQTNFAYCRQNPRAISDVLGIEGRLVKAGTRVHVAGALAYGGSRHVGNSVLEVSRKFPSVRSGLNIRYDTDTIRRARSGGLRIARYDRSLEPYAAKGREGRTVSWGTRLAISKLSSPPDIIYHTGDLGKEPMILVFGKSPGDVLSKVAKISGLRHPSN